MNIPGSMFLAALLLFSPFVSCLMATPLPTIVLRRRKDAGMEAMNEVRKCPKCGGEMKNGYIRGTGGQMYPVHFTDKVSFWRGGNRESTCAFACKNCGYTELYIERESAKP